VTGVLQSDPLQTETMLITIYFINTCNTNTVSLTSTTMVNANYYIGKEDWNLSATISTLV